MKIESSPREDHQVTLTVEFDPEFVEEARRRAARKIAKKIRVPGFRPGKAPYPVILRQIGEAELTEHALEELVEAKYEDIIKESGIEPYGPGSLEKIVSLEPMTLEFTIPLAAEVQLGNYQAIRIPYEPVSVSDEEVDQMIENMRERRAILESVDRPAEEGDVVSVYLSAERINNLEGEDATLLPESPRDILVRLKDDENQTSEWPFPGFSQELVGVKVGDEKSIPYKFPEDYEEFESLQGTEAIYRFRVDAIKSRRLPDLDENFLKELGEDDELKTIDDLRASVRKNIESYRTTEYNDTYDSQALDQLIDGATFMYPPQMLEHEIAGVIEGFERRLEQQGATLDLYLKTRELDQDGFREEVKPVAEARLKRQLVLIELAQSEGIKLEPEEVQHETARTVDYLSRSLPQNEARQLTNESVRNNLVGNIMVDMLSHKSIERLRSIANGSAAASESESDSATPEEQQQDDTRISEQLEPTHDTEDGITEDEQTLEV